MTSALEARKGSAAAPRAAWGVANAALPSAVDSMDNAPAMYTVTCVTGRLVEVRFLSMDTVDEARAYVADLVRLIERQPGPVVTCGDVRRSTTHVYAPEVAEVMLKGVATLNERIERAAVVLPPRNATFILQTERMVREAGHPSRRSFTSADDATAWLGQALTPDEQTRLEWFLDEGG